MIQLLAVIQLTFRESLAKKTFMAFFGISSLVCLLLIFALNLDIVNGMQSSISLFGQEADHLINIRDILVAVESILAIGLFTGGLFMSLFATSGLIPSMLQNGNIDLLISKPISRFQLLLGKFIGSVAIVAFNVIYLVGFSWFILSVKTGIWHWGFLISGVMIIFTFAILYTLMIFLGIIVRSSAFSLMITYLIIFFSPLLVQRDKIYALLSNKIYAYFFDGLYYFLPKTAELGAMTQDLVRQAAVSSWMPVWYSIFFALIMFVISSLIFAKKNF